MRLSQKSRPVRAAGIFLSLTGLLVLLTGCKSDVHHSLLERELTETFRCKRASTAELRAREKNTGKIAMDCSRSI
jgi:type III secretory pathway lipoprotein EscJ